MNILYFLCTGIVALTLSAVSAQCGVAWTFVETSCTSFNGVCQTPPLPLAVAELTLPDINSSGQYSYSSIPSPHETGDKDFLFNWGDMYSSPVLEMKGRGCPGTGGVGLGECFWDITFASSPAALQIAIRFIGSGPSFAEIGGSAGPFGPNGGQIGADGAILGCGSFVECTVTGFWELTGIPEPSSFAILCGAGIIFLLARRAGWRAAAPSDRL